MTTEDLDWKETKHTMQAANEIKGSFNLKTKWQVTDETFTTPSTKLCW